MKRTNLFFILGLTITMLSCNSEDPIANLDCSVSKTDVTTYDGNDGTITVTVNKGNGDYQFSLNSTITSPDGKFTSLTAGVYDVLVTDKENKTWTQTVTINQPDADDLVCTVTHTNVTTFGGNDGTITVTVKSGYSPYKYFLNDESVDSESDSYTFENLVAGDYIIKVIDDLDREFTETITITQPGQLTMSIEHTNVLCFGESNGTITVTASGENGIYEYKLDDDDFQSSNVFTDLSADTYTVTVKSGEVTISDDVTITQPTEPIGFVGDPIVVNASTFQGKGSIKVTATGGTSPYLYKLNDGEYVDNGGDFSDEYGVYPGTYSVTAKDANSCTVTVTDIVVINVNTFLPVIQDVTVTDKTETSAKINFKINPFGTTTSFYIEYGTTTSYGNTITLNNVSGSELIDISKNITDLVHGTVYYYNIVAENSDGTTNVSGSFSTRYIIGDEIDGGKVFFIKIDNWSTYYYVIKNQDETGLYNVDYLYTLPSPDQGWSIFKILLNYKDEMVSNINSLNGIDGFISPIENEKYWVNYDVFRTITFPNGNIEPIVETDSYKLRLSKIVKISL